MATRTVPEGIERLTPSQAWCDGYRIGREELAAGMTKDAAGEMAKDGRTHERLDALERAVKKLGDDGLDAATRATGIEKRVEKLEGGKVE